MKRKLVIGFIVKGLQTYFTHIQPFVVEAKKRGHETLIFHLDDYYGTSKISKADIPAKIFNLKHYWNYHKLFSSFNVDKLVFLNPGHVFDVFLVDLLKQTNVKTIYLQHGIKSNKIQPNTQVKKVKSNSLAKYLFFYNRIVYSLFHDKMKKRRLKNTIQRIMISLFQGSSDYVSLGIPSAHCDYAFVYTISDMQILKEKINYLEHNIFKIGMTFIKPAKTSKKIEVNEHHKRVVLYISSGLRQASVISIDDSIEQAMYRKLHNEALKSNYKLIVKIHPRENLDKVKSYFTSDKDIVVYKEANLADLVIEADVVLGDYSTALLYAVKYYKPIGLLSYDYFSVFPFDLALYNIGYKFHINELSHYLNSSDLQIVSKKNYDILLEELSSEFNKRLEDYFYDVLEAIN